MTTQTQVQTVRSADGTSIAYDRTGEGPAVILIGGATMIRQYQAPLAAVVASDFTVLNYDRRGRGDSGDTLPYALAREVEDIGALIGAAGESANLFGISSGGGLALEAAAAGLSVDRLAVYEVPYNVTQDGQLVQRDYIESLDRLLAQGRRGDAVELFLRTVGVPDEGVAEVRASPSWEGLEAIAHTLAYDAASMGTGQPPVERLRRIAAPTMVITGDPEGEHEVGGKEFFEAAAREVVASILNATHYRLPGQTHAVDPQAIGPVLAAFYKAGS